MKRPKPHRRLARAQRPPVVHPTGLSRELLAHRIKQLQQEDEVTPGEMERDVLAFLGALYNGRVLRIETAQLALSNVAQRLIVAHLRAAAQVRH